MVRKRAEMLERQVWQVEGERKVQKGQQQGGHEGKEAQGRREVGRQLSACADAVLEKYLDLAASVVEKIED